MGHKILLADDSITIQKVIELTFSDEDFELHTVGNGQKAIDEIRSIMPDVVLCDIIMPEKNGYEVCEFIKSSADLKHIPVLLLTGAFEPFDQERAKAAGCEGFLAKPFEPQTLISRVKELLENAAQPAPAAAPAPAPAQTPTQAPPAAPASFDSMESDATVMVPPPSAAAAPPRASGPQVTPSPSPPPADASGSGVDDAFAVEAGERELSMGPSDHTVLLGAEDVASSASSGSGSSSNDDDVWGQVTAQSDEEEASTVFMAAPPPIAEAPKPHPPQQVPSSGSDPDATWQMPSEGPGKSDSAPDGSGFQEFAEPPSPPEPPKPAAPPQPQADAFEPVFEAETEPQPAEASFEPVESQSYQDFEPMSADTQASGFTTDATIDPVVSSDPFEPEPEVVSAPPPAPPAPAPSTPKAAPAPPAPPRSPAPQPATPAPASAASSNSDGVDEALVEKIAQRVVDKLSSQVIQEIAWEVVPDLAEGLIVKEIEALKAKIPK